MTRMHSLVDDVWKACDLRGVYPDAASPGLFENVGSAIGTMLAPGSRVLIAGDYRLSTSELKAALTRGLVRAGVHLLDAGRGPTPLAYFAGRQLGADAVLMITASHNAACYNGLKLMLGAIPMTPGLMTEIRKLTESGMFRKEDGRLENVDLRPVYLRTMLTRWKNLQGRPKQRVVIDAGNGAWSEMAPVIFRDLGFETVCISCNIDGRFPDRSPDCARAANLAGLRAAVRNHPNAVGVAWDGDGDRVAFVDEDGECITHDEVAILFARSALKAIDRQTGGKIVIDIKCSDAVRRAVLDGGGEPLIERTGHAFMRGRMVAEDALLGLDACGHYFFRELNGGDDGLFAALHLLNLMRRDGGSLRELRKTTPSIYSTPELRIPAAELSFAEAKRALLGAFPTAEMTDFDGLRLMVANGVVLIRESGTEPVLSLRIEGFEHSSYQHILRQTTACLPVLTQFLRQERDPAISA